MKTVAIRKAKATRSALLVKIERGEQIAITRNGKPIAELIRIEPNPQRLPNLLGKLPAWRDFTFDPSDFAPLTDKEIAAEGWHV
jgi:antitoxin (DNA-binding transcriptional repressor) of toxin-antitoxin stability system